MVDNLPLIPGKSAACTDVRSVLRTVFQEIDYLPPLSVDNKPLDKTDLTSALRGHKLPDVHSWPEKYETECIEICNRENDIMDQHGQRIALEPLPNIFKLHAPKTDKPIYEWRLDNGLLQRKDLVPGIEQNASGDCTLWIKNILNVSSLDVSRVEINSAPGGTILTSDPSKESTLQTLSIGQVMRRSVHQAPPGPPPTVRLEHVICVPPELSFLNCSIGRLYVKRIRLINVSKFEWRLSITPPKRNEFKVIINSSRGLTITSGANVDLSVQFIPTDVRRLTDTLKVRVSCGQVFVIPITCYMQPPVLDILIPNANPSLAPTSDRISFVCQRYNPDSGDDVLELGARLLGDVHCSLVLLRCSADHVKFFILTEDAWIDWNINCLTTHCSVVGDSFVFWPAWFSGGGNVEAYVWCCGNSVGAHETALRILSSTAISRPLNLLADVLCFSPQHLVIEAHEKNFGICDEDDPACKYHVNLGSAFPHRSVSATIKLVNRSPITYNFYWDVRQWGICSCWEEEIESKNSIQYDEDSERLCPGALESKHMAHEDPEAYARKIKPSPIVKVEPAEGQVIAGNACLLQVEVPDVGDTLGLQRSVLRLILKDIPMESFPADYEPIILQTMAVTSVPIPGLQSSVREVCNVLLAEMEVWWEVLPVRFVLETPVIPLFYSRRLNAMNVYIGAWQLFGHESLRASWVTPTTVAKPPSLHINTVHCVSTCFKLPLPSLPNEYPETDLFTLVADNNEWKANCVVSRQCESRHPSLHPARAWLGIVTPKTRMRSIFSLKNDTYQRIRFWCKAFRWLGENQPSPACVGRNPCTKCKEIACTCALLKPGRGTLSHGESTDIFYNVNAPQSDGCVATLIQVRRCEADLSIVHDAPATEARAALVAYRVLAPRLVIRLLPCEGTSTTCQSDCELDTGALNSELGSSILRPSKSLVLGRRTCYRLRVTNITPLPTSVHFDDPIDGMENLKAKFIPNVFRMRSYGEVDIRVILYAVKVCERRTFVYRADVTQAYKPIYVVIDAAIVGVEVSVQVPIGGGIKNDEFFIMRRSQREEHGVLKRRPSEQQDIFIAEDKKRAFVQANVCHCHIEMKYIPPVKRPSPPLGEDEDYPIEIVTKPPSFTRVCRCFPYTKPSIRDAPESISIEFIGVPLRTVRERRVTLSNESVLTAYWSTTFRRWPKQRRRTINTDKWADEVCESGVALACCPPSGVLASRARVDILVQVYADTWGLYRDQLLIQVENIEPIVLDVWIHVGGPPLEFKIQPKYTPNDLPTVWLSPTDSTRSLIVKNVSRSELLVSAYVTLENERVQDVLPFRLYLRMYDILPMTCPCVTTYESALGEQSTSSPSYTNEDMDTAVELYLAPDHGQQNDTYYNVTPEACTIKAGESLKWEVAFESPSLPETAADGTLILWLKPLRKSGDSWYREEPAPQLVQLRQVVTVPQVKLSCGEVVAKICVLDLPYGDFLRIRKRFQLLNVGSGHVNVSLQTGFPWCVVQGRPSHSGKEMRCDIGCETFPRNEHRDSHVKIDLPPRSSTEVCVEVCISTMEAWPHGSSTADSACVPPQYALRRQENTPLFVYDDDQMLFTLPLIVDMEYPEIKTEPQTIDFGFVTDGDSRKTYASVSHTCSTKTLTLAVRWLGSKEFEIWPHFLEVAPGCSQRVYIQYTAVWRHGPAEGCVVVNVCCGAGDAGQRDKCLPPSGWCRAALPVRAAPTLDHKWHTHLHDHTDDTHLFPKSLQKYLP